MVQTGNPISIDVSGAPPDLVVVGGIGFNLYKKEEIIDEFFAEFPRYIERKGSKPSPYELEDIVNFLSQKGKNVKMVSKKFTPNDWHFVSSSFPNKADVEEKIFRMLYFSVLRRIADKQYKHPVVMCIESHINIGKAQKIGCVPRSDKI